MSEPKKHSRFLALPPELRNRIYRLALVKPHDTISVTCSEFKEPALLYACHQTRDEALQIYYEENTFMLIFPSFDSAVGLKWTKKIRKLHGDRKINSVTRSAMCTGRANWNALMLWLRRYHTWDVMVGYRGEAVGPLSKDGLVGSMMFETVEDLKSSPWPQVEKILSRMRFLLVDCDAGWNDDLEP